MAKKGPVNVYLSKCCNASATKEPCERSKEEIAKREFGQHSLGTWRCGACHKVAAVTVHKNLDK